MALLSSQVSALHLQVEEIPQASPSHDAGSHKLAWFFQGMGLAALMLAGVYTMGGLEVQHELHSISGKHAALGSFYPDMRGLDWPSLTREHGGGLRLVKTPARTAGSKATASLELEALEQPKAKITVTAAPPPGFVWADDVEDVEEGVSVEEVCDQMNLKNVDTLARVASARQNIPLQDIESVRAIPLDDSHLLIEAMTCDGEQNCNMYAVPIDIPGECVVSRMVNVPAYRMNVGISTSCEVDSLETSLRTFLQDALMKANQMRPAAAPRSGVVAMGLFDGMGAAVGAVSGDDKPLVDADRVTPFDRWLGNDKALVDEQKGVVDESAEYIDPGNTENYFSVMLPKPMGIAFVANEMGSGVYVDQVLPEGSAASEKAPVAKGDQLVGVDSTVVHGASFDDALDAIKGSSGEKTKLTFFRGRTVFLYGPTAPTTEWYQTELLK